MGKKSTKLTKIGEDDMTLAGRIKIGMAAKGIKNPTELARRMKLNRQTVHKWTAGQVVKIEPEYLFKLADTLEMNPRWLATKQGNPQPERSVSPDQQRIIDLYKALPDGVRDSWLQSGDALLTASGKTSKAQPFKTAEAK